MAVFMGTRQRYQLARFQYHSRFAWTVLLTLLLAPCIALASNNKTLPVAGALVTTAALTSKRGRDVGKRLTKEVFYGCLFTFTGVFQTTGANRVGK